MDWTMIESEKLQEPPLLRKDFEKAIKSARPTVSQVDITKHNEWTMEFGSEGA
jgi:vacuolar protein-sorting-associated protein 4